MRKNSWISQWGVLVLWGIPCLLQGGKKEALFAVVIGGLLCLGVEKLIRCTMSGEKQKEIGQDIYKYFQDMGIAYSIGRGILCFVGLVLSIGGIVRVARWYSEAITEVWLFVLLLIVTLFIGGKRGKEGRQAMAGIWGKVLVLAIGAVLFFQIPGLLEEKGRLFMAGDEKNHWSQSIYMGVELLFLNLPFLLLETFQECKEKKRHFHGVVQNGIQSEKIKHVLRWGTLWGSFGATVFCLMGLWEMEILTLAPFPYLLLGQTGRTFAGTAIRLEMLSFLITVISLYFSARLCVDGLKDCWDDEEIRTKCKQGALVIIAGILVGIVCTGCGRNLGEKKLVLIGDENMLAAGEGNLELSCMKILVVHEGSFQQIAAFLLEQPNISYETYVVYSREPIEQDLTGLMEETGSAEIMEYIEELTRRGTDGGLNEYVTIREFLNCGVKNKEIVLPQLEIVDESIKVTGNVVYKNTSSIH